MYSDLEYSISKYGGGRRPAYLRESHGFDKYTAFDNMIRDWVCPTNHKSHLKNYFLNSYLHDDRNMKIVIQRFTDCKECVNILYKFARQRIPKLLQVWKQELNEFQSYKTFVMYTNEITILPLLVAIQRKHKKVPSKPKQKLKKVPDKLRRKKVSYKPKRQNYDIPSKPVTMQRILNHPLYTPDVWRSVIRLATF
jgi:hypothetical protein